MALEAARGPKDERLYDCDACPGAVRVQRRCTKPLPEAGELARELEALGVGGIQEGDVRGLLTLDMETVPARRRFALVAQQRALAKLAQEQERTQEADACPPGPSNPYACPLLKVAVGALGWLGLVGFDGFGAPKSLTLDPLDEPQRAYEAVMIVASERSRALKRAAPKPQDRTAERPKHALTARPQPQRRGSHP